MTASNVLRGDRHGKETVVRAIHINSARDGKLLVKVNCAALRLVRSSGAWLRAAAFDGEAARRLGRFEPPTAARCSSMRWATRR